jgi:hypothetical protein
LPDAESTAKSSTGADFGETSPHDAIDVKALPVPISRQMSASHYSNFPVGIA